MVKLSTTKGDIIIELNERDAPQTVENFLSYVDAGFYDDTLFHRVIEGFMIQGGGFNRNYQKKSTRAPVSNEAYNGLRNRRYTIAMARTTAPHSATSQFFINSEDNRNLDHTDTTQRGWGYTVFGRVVDGQEVVDAISRVRTGPGGPFSRDVPSEPVIILSAARYSQDAETAASAAVINNDSAPSTAKTSAVNLQKEGNDTLPEGESRQPVEQN
ncbi:MAG: peptidyl-prolyl cis-trans isomerase [Granulosicoccus sp.]|nr:peptidyl-prolyl cis-trans isomerase [Granulosicoccus sp.]